MEGRPRPFQRLIETRRNFAVRATIASMHPNGELEQKESDHELWPVLSCRGPPASHVEALRTVPRLRELAVASI